MKFQQRAQSISIAVCALLLVGMAAIFGVVSNVNAETLQQGGADESLSPPRPGGSTSEPRGTVLGTVTDGQGNVLTDIEGVAYARQNTPDENDGEENDGEGSGINASGLDGDRGGKNNRRGNRRNRPRGTHARVENGQFSLQLPTGTYTVGARLRPGSRYFLTAPQSVEVDATADVTPTVTLVLDEYSSTIAGTILMPDGNPAVGLKGKVYASTSDEEHPIQVAKIVSETAQYELPVHPGTYNIRYSIKSQDYLRHNTEPVSVTVADGQTETQDFTLIALDATIQGTVTDADGNPISRGYVKASEVTTEDTRPLRAKARVINGQYEMRIVSGREYTINARAGRSSNAIQPDTQTITPDANSTTTVDLQFQAANATISGVVSLEDGSPAGRAHVYGWTESGQHVRTKANEQGEYTLNALNNRIWNVSASLRSRTDQTFYRTDGETQVDLNGTDAATQDLTLVNAETLPDDVDDAFATARDWSTDVGDGAHLYVPANAVPARNVRVTVQPLTEDLPRTAEARPVGYGYDIKVYNDETGQQINGEFDTDATLTFYYTDADLAQAGAQENEIAPAYLTDEGTWSTVDSFTIDADNNQISTQIDQASQWTLVTTTAESTSSQLEFELFLPLTVR